MSWTVCPKPVRLMHQNNITDRSLRASPGPWSSPWASPGLQLALDCVAAEELVILYQMRSRLSMVFHNMPRMLQYRRMTRLAQCLQIIPLVPAGTAQWLDVVHLRDHHRAPALPARIGCCRPQASAYLEISET